MSTNTQTINWKETTLNKVSDIQTGPFGSQLHNSDYVKEGTPIITVEHLLDDRITHSEDIPKVSIDDTARLSKRYSLKEGDIVFSRVGSVDRSAYVSESENGWLFSGRLLRVRPNKEIVSSRWLDYWLRQEKIKQFVRQIAVGATMPSINTSLLGEVPVLLPSLDEQNTIAQIFYTLEKKIDILRKQNDTLEQIAQAIFNEWFVKPNVEATLPKGWKMYQLGELADIISGYSYKGTDLVESSPVGMVNLKNFDRNGGFKTDGLKPITGTPKQTQEVKIGDVVVAHTDITQDAAVLGNAAMIFDTGGFERLYISMDVAKVIPKQNITNDFLYFLMRTSSFKQHCVAYANGTTVLHLPRVAVPEYEVTLPEDLDTRTIHDFNSIAASVIKKIVVNVQSISTLTSIRNALLPQLMSGEIKV